MPPLRTVLKNFLNRFEDYEAKKTLSEDQYEYEFQQLKKLTDSLKEDSEYSCSCGLKDVNRPKNRYKDIVPYDRSRVILPRCEGIPGSDYINASYVKGSSGASAYIAAQGPLPNTLIDFWRMIWTCDVQVLVMACNEIEAGRPKCEIYWPEKGEILSYGDISVELVTTSQTCKDFMVRTLLVKCDSEMRDVYQFHYSTWPDHGVPQSVFPILELVRLMRDCQASETVPIVVHCSAGCGRTGTICAVDYVWASLRHGKLPEDFSLFQIALELRRQRIAMIQTKEQYILAHKAVATLFEQQLNVIDCHIYVNVDEEGEPLMWKELIKNKQSQFLRGNSPALNCSSIECVVKQKGVKGIACPLDNPLVKTETQISGAKKIVSSPSNSENFRSSSENNPSTENTSTDCAPRKFYLNQQNLEDGIPFIDEDEVCLRPNCGRGYLDSVNYDTISKLVNNFDPFVDKIAVEMDSSPDVDQKDSINKVPGHHLSADALASQSMQNISSFTQSVNEQMSKNRESYPSASGSSKHKDLKLPEAILGSTKDKNSIDKVFSRRPSISKLKALFERSGMLSHKSRNDSEKGSIFRNKSLHVSRAGSAPPSLNCMDKNSHAEKNTIMEMVTRKFRSSSVRTEKEINTKFYGKEEKNTDTIGNLKDGLSTLSRNISLNINKKFHTYRPSRYKPPLTENRRVSLTGDDKLVINPTSSDEQSKPPKLTGQEQKGKSIWYDRSSLPRAVSIGKPIEKNKFDPIIAEATKNLSVSPDNEEPLSLLLTTQKITPIINNTVERKNPKTMWYNAVGDTPSESSLYETKSETLSSIQEPSKDPTKSHRVLPFIQSLTPWKKASTKSSLVSPSSSKLFPGQQTQNSTSNSTFYTTIQSLEEEPFNYNSVKEINNEYSCPVPEEIIPLRLNYKKSKDYDDKITTSKVKSDENASTLNETKKMETATIKIPSKPEVMSAVEGEKNEISGKQARLKGVAAKVQQDAPPAIPKKISIGKKYVDNKQLETTDEAVSLKVQDLQINETEIPSAKPLCYKNELSQQNERYINVNVKTMKNMEQIENALRTNPRGAIIDLTSRESYCLEEELEDAVKQLEEPSQIIANKSTAKYPGYEVIWPEAGISSSDLKNIHNHLKLNKAALCYSPPLRRNLNSSLGLTKCHSCSNINWLNANERSSGTSLEPTNTPTKKLVNEAVVELSSLLDRLTTQTLSEELSGELSKPNPVCLPAEAAKEDKPVDKGNLMVHSVTLMSKLGGPDSSPKEEEIIFHFPPPPLLPPPDEDQTSESFNIVRRNGSLFVAERDVKSNDLLSKQSGSEFKIPQPAPRKSKQSSSVRRSSSYTHLYDPECKSKRYENVFLEKYKTSTSLKITTDDIPKNIDNVKEDCSVKMNKPIPNYINVSLFETNPFNTSSKSEGSALLHEHLKLIERNSEEPSLERKSLISESESNDSKSILPSTKYCTVSTSTAPESEDCIYGRIYSFPNREASKPTKVVHQYENTTNILEQKQKRPSKKSERAPMPPDIQHFLETKLAASSSASIKKPISRKLEKAPLPPPLLKSLTATNLLKKPAPKASHYMNFPIGNAQHKKEHPSLEAVIENLPNTQRNEAVDLTKPKKEPKSHHTPVHPLSYSQSDASVFLALKERKSKSLHRGQRVADMQQHFMNKAAMASRELTPVSSSSDSDSGYQRILINKVSTLPYAHHSKQSEDKLEHSSPSMERKGVPIAPPRARRRNTTEIEYAKVKIKDASSNALSLNQEQKNNIPLAFEPPPAIPAKTKDAFELPDEFGVKSSSRSCREFYGTKPSSNLQS